MVERIEPVKQGKLKNNITRFRQDKRLAVTGVLYSLSLIGMLACVVFGIVRYHESLRPENLSRLAAYVKAAGTMTDPFTHYDALSLRHVHCGNAWSGLVWCSGIL